MPDEIPFKNRIRKFRYLAGLTQEELAKELHIHREYLSKIEIQMFTPRNKINA